MKDEVKKCWNSTKAWCKRHKKAILIVGGTVVGIVIFKKGIDAGRGLYLTDTAQRTSDLVDFFGPDNMGVFAVSDEIIRSVDENIFTDLAPEIEGGVLAKCLKHGSIERVYNLGDMVKKVAVTIDSV